MVVAVVPKMKSMDALDGERGEGRPVASCLEKSSAWESPLKDMDDRLRQEPDGSSTRRWERLRLHYYAERIADACWVVKQRVFRGSR